MTPEKQEIREWMEIEGDKSSLAFGRTGKDDMLYIRIKFEKDNVKAECAWGIDAIYVISLLAKWFPPDATRQESAPGPGTGTPGEPQK